MKSSGLKKVSFRYPDEEKWIFEESFIFRGKRRKSCHYWAEWKRKNDDALFVQSAVSG